MAAIMKRVPNEILVRFDLQGTVQGTHIKYVRYLTEDDGVTPAHQPALEDATATDWNSSDIQSFITVGVASLEKNVATLSAENSDLQETVKALTAENDNLSAQLVALTAESKKIAADYERILAEKAQVDAAASTLKITLAAAMSRSLDPDTAPAIPPAPDNGA